MFRDIVFRALLPFWMILGVTLLAFFIGFAFDPYLAPTAAFTAMFICAGVLVVYAVAFGVPPMPTKVADEQAIVSLIPGHAKTIYELGSGWGHLAAGLARAHPDKTIIGIEISPLPFFWSRVMQKFSRQQNFHLRRADFFHVDLTDADVIVTYLFPQLLEKLWPKLKAECPHAILISNYFRLPGHKPASEHGAIAVYKISASV